LLGIEDNPDIFGDDRAFGIYTLVITLRKIFVGMSDNREYCQFQVAAADKRSSIGKMDI
jgi:hypothetical protein